MAKIWMLIQNEIIKLMKRKSLPVMIVLIIVASICAAFLFNFSNAPESDGDQSSDYLIGEWKKEIKDLERFFAMDHYLDDVYADNSMRAKEYRNRSEMLQYLVENNYTPFDWRYSSGLIERIFENKFQMDLNYNFEYHKSEYDRLMRLAEKNDWKEYYKELAEKQEAEFLFLHPMAESEVKDAAWYEYNYRTENDYCPGAELWRDRLIASVVSSKFSLAYFVQEEYERIHEDTYTPPSVDPAIAKPNLSLDQIAQNRPAVLNKLAVALYRLDHEVKTDVNTIFEEESIVSSGETSGFWKCFSSSSNFILIIGVLIIIISGLIVASEFSSGTIKFLLVSPVKRWKIVIAKYFTVISLSVLFTALLYVSSILASLVVFGGTGFFDEIVRVKDGIAWGVSPFILVLKSYCWAFIEVVVVATMAFAISSIMRSTAVSIGVGLFVYLSGTVIPELCVTFGFDFGRYTLFANMDLPAIIDNVAIFPNQTIAEAIIIIVGHMAVFLLAAWDGFVRREI